MNGVVVFSRPLSTMPRQAVAKGLTLGDITVTKASEQKQATV